MLRVIDERPSYPYADGVPGRRDASFERQALPDRLGPMPLALAVCVASCGHVPHSVPRDGGRALPLGNDRVERRRPAHLGAPRPAALPTGSWTVLPSEEAWRVLDNCTSGGLITGVQGFWAPAPTDVAEVDGAVGRLFAYQRDQNGEQVFPLSRGLLSYYRQYVGVRVPGRSLIVVAGFSAVEAEAHRETLQRTEPRQPPLDWRRKSLGTWCGGGQVVFRAAYDVDSAKFVLFRFGTPIFSCCEPVNDDATRICGEAILCSSERTP